VGPRQRPPEGVVEYRLGEAAAARRALAVACIGASTALAPVMLAVVLLQRLGWAATPLYWAVAAALVALVVGRAVVGHAVARRKLRALVVTVDDEAIRVASTPEGYGIERARVASIVEVEGLLGGIRVESQPDAHTQVVDVANVPRGGEGYTDVRARLATWRGIERRGRRGPAVRVALGVVVVAAIFFVPFLRDDVLSRSKWVAALLVVGTWIVMRRAMRGG
jgi:hypothetical protein